MEVGAGVTINPIAFLVITTENVRLIPVNHSSSLDRLIDYMPDLIEKTNQMMNKCIQNKNIIKFELNGIFDIKMIHIISTICILKKKRRVYKNERTSNRRTYDDCYE